MTVKEAIRILNPKTSAEAIAEISDLIEISRLKKLKKLV